MSILPVDLEHDGLPGAISTWLVDGEEPALVDPGPTASLDTLEARLDAAGVPLSEVRHVVLTHVHLDHAGSAGVLARRNPRLVVHVHEDGAVHLADPDRLVASTRRTFGEDHDRLWGDVVPVPRDRIRAWRPGERSTYRPLRPFHTPGHIDHHVAWLDERTGTLLAGDALGIGLAPDAPVHPPTPPPSLDLPAWHETLASLLPVGPERVAVAHFGLHRDFHARREALDEALTALESRVRGAMEEGRTEEDARMYEREVRDAQATVRDRDEVERYFDVFTAARDYRGVEHHLERRARRGTSRPGAPQPTPETLKGGRG